MDVRTIQLRLTNHGFYPGLVDGKLGPKTQGAMKAFQQNHNLMVTGKANDSTVVALVKPFPKIKVNADTLHRVGVPHAIARDKALQYEDLLDTHNIDTILRASHFFGQVMHETQKFRSSEENLNYTAERILAVWPNRFSGIDEARLYARNPEALANKVYGGRMGNIRTGDGWLYRGRGDIQLTGADNYFRFFGWMRLSIDTDPALVATKYSAGAAVWYWTVHGLNQFAAADQHETITKRINGGTNGLRERIAYTEQMKEALCKQIAFDAVPLPAPPVPAPKPEPTPHIKPVTPPPPTISVDSVDHQSSYSFGKPRR